MAELPEGSVNLILADLPYGTTACKWDAVLPFDRLWAAYKRLLAVGGAVVLTASQPFTSALVMSNPSWYKHQWVWNKGVAGNFTTAKVAPMKIHEDVLVFAPGKVPYFPIMVPREKPIKLSASGNKGLSQSAKLARAKPEYNGKIYTEKYPETILHYSSRGAGDRGLHPTQKPVGLMAYMVRTYTRPGDVVLDNCMGSGTTGVAAVREGRRFIGVEQDAEYFEKARKRIEAERAVVVEGPSCRDPHNCTGSCRRDPACNE